MNHDLALGNDLSTAAVYQLPTEAHIVQGCLAAAGIPAMVADANLLQAYSTLGGVRVIVATALLRQALAVIAAFDRGDYRLGDDVDVGKPDPTSTP